MPPRIHVCQECLQVLRRIIRTPSHIRNYATVQAFPSPSLIEQSSVPPQSTYPPTQPPSHKPPEFRKSQLHRQYTSLLRTTPLMLLFQHNNLKATEWMSVRRELAQALRKVDESRAVLTGQYEDLGDGVKMQIIQTGIFAAALRVAEYFDPGLEPEQRPIPPSDSDTALPRRTREAFPDVANPTFRHGLSRNAYEAVKSKRFTHELNPLLSGPLAILSFPEVTIEHLKAALSILAPNPPNFPAPTRRANPGYHDPSVQAGLQKLMLLGARVEGRVFDLDGTRWVGSIEGGLDGLRGQLVALLQSFAAGVTNTLESAGKNLYITMDSRRTMLEQEEKEGGGPS